MFPNFSVQTARIYEGQNNKQLLLINYTSITIKHSWITHLEQNVAYWSYFFLCLTCKRSMTNVTFQSWIKIGKWMQLNQESYHCVLHIKYWNFHRMPNYVQLNTKWMQLCAQNFSSGVSIWRLFLSWVFFQLEAKYTQLPDDLKQCNRSYISMTNPICIKTEISKI
jgi:hypothetical protein